MNNKYKPRNQSKVKVNAPTKEDLKRIELMKMSCHYMVGEVRPLDSPKQLIQPTTEQLIDGILEQKQNDNEPLPLIAPYRGMYGKPWTKDDHKRFGVAMEKVHEIRQKQNDND